MTVKNGTDEGIKGWTRHTDGSTTQSSWNHSPGCKLALVAGCSLPRFNGIGLKSFLEYAWDLSTRHEFQKVGVGSLTRNGWYCHTRSSPSGSFTAERGKGYDWIVGGPFPGVPYP